MLGAGPASPVPSPAPQPGLSWNGTVGQGWQRKPDLETTAQGPKRCAMFLVAWSRFLAIGGPFPVLIAVAVLFPLCFLSPTKRKVKIVVNLLE